MAAARSIAPGPELASRPGRHPPAAQQRRRAHVPVQPDGPGRRALQQPAAAGPSRSPQPGRAGPNLNRFDDLILAAALHYSLSPALVKAVMAVESNLSRGRCRWPVPRD